jgi:potassium-transporting ATPase KdpC subunit
MIRPAIVLLLLFTALTGGAYPAAMTGLAKVLFSDKAEGSLVTRQGQVVGSELIGQPFDDPKYFFGRASTTGPYAYNAGASTGSNHGPSNPALKDAVAARVRALKELDPTNAEPVPVELVTASGSGLDPHISPQAALWQVQRVARVRGADAALIRGLVDAHTEDRTLGILGEPRVNVLLLNLDLDAKFSPERVPPAVPAP